MSNLIQNGDFQSPLLESGLDLQYTAPPKSIKTWYNKID